ncbi:hypothetical protein J3E06_000742 [Methanococcus voltae]|uniref:Uncharacterized protein n=1 Tax=Methanococcus voltae (strain ATCC BAA-1334 / A3) TaxID=456320 RepID=D7DRC1_METV3|nr:hypothetical protein [Methanococcus voltae]
MIFYNYELGKIFKIENGEKVEYTPPVEEPTEEVQE